MGQIVGAFGVPHTPRFPIVAREDTLFASEIVRLYGEVANRLRELDPDVLLIFSTDHFQNFFSQIPIFSIGVAESTDGPCDQPDLPPYKVAVDYKLAQDLQYRSVKSGFDVGVNFEFSLDHTFMVPYHFLAQGLHASMIPVFISGLVAPTPSAKRCFALGTQIRSAIESIDDSKRIVVIASGSFSLDLGGIHQGAEPSLGTDGVTDSAWVDTIVSLLRNSDASGLVRGATDEQIFKAGNIGGEVLNWIAMLGTFDSQPPSFLERQGTLGHAFGAWILGGANHS